MSETKKKVMRTGHPYHLYESIIRTPKDLEACFEGDTWKQVEELGRLLRTRNTRRLFISGTGSSFFASIAAGYAFRQLAGIPAEVGVTSELGAYPPVGLSEQDAWLFVSHSGGTVGDEPVVEMARSRGVLTVAVTDIHDSRLTGCTDVLLPGPSGAKPELPATRTYSTAVLRMVLLAAELTEDSSQKARFFGDARRLPSQLHEVVDDTEKKVENLEAALWPCSYFAFLGSGPNTATAHEGALGFSQALEAQAQGFILEEWLHGPIQTLTRDMGVVVIAPEGPRQQRMLDVLRAVQFVGAKTLAVGAEGFAGLQEADAAVMLPRTPALLSPLLAISPLWQIGYRFAIRSGKNPDRLSMDQEVFQNAMELLMSSDLKFTSQRTISSDH